MDGARVPSTLLEAAVELAAEWIRHRRYQPGSAITRAARRYGVDRYLVAQRVGSRGAHQANALRRVDPATIPIELIILHIDEITLVDADTVKVLAHPVAGPLVGIQSDFRFRSAGPPQFRVGDGLLCRVQYLRDSKLQRFMQIVECVEVVKGEP